MSESSGGTLIDTTHPTQVYSARRLNLVAAVSFFLGGSLFAVGAALAGIGTAPLVTVNVTYLGSFGPESKRVAVFADESGQNLYNARTGDVLEGKFIVYRIGYESVDLKFVGFPDEPARRLAIGG